MNSLKRGRVGPKKKDYALNGRIRNIPLNRRKTVRALAGALNIPKSSLHRRIKNGDVKVCTSPLKPFLTDANKEKRIMFILRQLHFFENGKIRFPDMFDMVHIDEKWFYLTEEKGRYYLEKDEIEPHRQVKSKRFITMADWCQSKNIFRALILYSYHFRKQVQNFMKIY